MKKPAGLQTIAICGEIFSPNLGDGVIADSLSYLIKKANHKVEVVTVDFSSRISYSSKEVDTDSVSKSISFIRKLMHRYQHFRSFILLFSWYFLKRKNIRRYWKKKIENASILIIGGGQLLNDNGIWPIKIYELVKIACELNIKIAFYACGSSETWSWIGRRYLSKSIFNNSVSWISTRDLESKLNIERLFPNHRTDIKISVDPAIYAPEVYQTSKCIRSNNIGLGVTAPHEISGCVNNRELLIYTNRVRKFWTDLAYLLISDNKKVSFFCNGNSEDYAFGKSIITNLRKRGIIEGVCILPKPLDPKILVNQIRNFKAIVAHRLHANIIAYSLCIPSISLMWDKKVLSFAKITDRSYYCMNKQNMEATIIKKRLYEAIESGIDKSLLAKLKANLQKNVCSMIKELGIE